MGRIGLWLAPALAMAFATGCPAAGGAGTTTGKTTSNSALKLPSLDFGSGTIGDITSAIESFKSLNSSGGNFTMPIGNNFTMPIGNNFTMPIGNNLTSTAYRVQGAIGAKLLFGFAPLAADTVFTGSNQTLAAADASKTATQSLAVAGTGVAGTLDFSWWTPTSSTDDGYQNLLTYSALSMTAAGAARSVTGSYAIMMSGPKGWTAAATDAKYGGAVLLGVNANPSSITERKDVFKLKEGPNTVMDLALTQSAYTTLNVPVASKDIQIPTAVSLAGSIVTPGGTSSMGINLASTLDNPTTQPSFTIKGWLKKCSGATCTATAASSATGAAGETREEFTLDVPTASSKLVFTTLPSGTAKFGYRITMYYDYAAGLLKGVGGSTPLTGKMMLIDSTGLDVAGGKIADIVADSSGNPVITYTNGRVESWKL